MKAVAGGDEDVLASLRRVCAPECLLEIIIGIDEERDAGEIERLALPRLSEDFLQKTLIPKYATAGFEILKSGVLSFSEWSQIETSWARKLQTNDNRRCFFMIFRAGNFE